MLKVLIAISFLTSVSAIGAHAQTKSFHNINEAINHHVSELKKGNWKNLKHIYVSVKLDTTITENNVLTIQNDLDPRYLKKDETNLLVQVTLKSKSNKTEFTIVDFNVKKKSRHHLILINLGSGGQYIIE